MKAHYTAVLLALIATSQIALAQDASQADPPEAEVVTETPVTGDDTAQAESENAVKAQPEKASSAPAESYRSSEKISEDKPVSFPVDI